MRYAIRQMIFVLTAGLFIIFPINAETINEKFLQTQWTTENGLPQNSVTAIAQTPEGYLWLGTFGGLTRFDGVHFKIYTTANTSELKSNRITALKTDKHGRLWIGTENGEIIHFKDGKFTLIGNGSQSFGMTSEFFVDENNIVWAAASQKLLRCTFEGCTAENYPYGTTRIRKDENGDFWIISEFQLYKAESGNFAESRLVFRGVRNIEINPQGGVWLVFADKLGLYRDGKYETLGEFPLGFYNSDFSFAQDGSVWMSVGSHLFNIRQNSIDKFQDANFEREASRAIFVDRENNVWLGRMGDGLMRLLPRRVNTLTGKNGFPAKTAANSIVEDADGNVWIATNRGLVRWREGKTDIFAEQSYGLDNVTRGALLVDRRGVLWNHTSAGLQNFINGRLISRDDLPLEPSESGNAFFEDSRGNYWVGCAGYGIYKITDGKIVNHYTARDGLVYDKAVIFAETHDGTIWIGTTNGVSSFKDGVFTNYKSENGLSNDYVRDIYEDADGTLWFGTYGGGLNRFRDGKFTPITTKDGLFDDIVSRILVDDDDNFWLLGNRGIYSVNRKMLNDFADGRIRQIFCAAFTTADGMLTSEGNGGFQNAGMRARDGRLWFPMIDGVVIIDPRQEKLPPPKPLIEDVFLNGNAVDISKKVEINPGIESLEINYTGLNFRKPEQIRFRYRLAGLDKNWTEAGKRRLTNYPYLPSGNYRFQLAAANADGVWSEEIAEFEIVVYPPFWKTWWFSALIAVAAVLILLSAYLYRNRRFARARALQEEYARKLLNTQEAERRRIAADIHDNLGQQLLVIKNWAGYCLSKITAGNELQQRIEQIDETAEQALEEVRAMAKNLSPYHLDKAGLTNTLTFMIRQVAESSGINVLIDFDDLDNFLPKEDEIYLYRIVQEAMNNIIKHSAATEAKTSAFIRGNILKMQISDNGRGFRYYQTENENFGHGLSGMIKRAEMINGNLNIISSRGNGTLIVLEIDNNHR